MKLVEKISRKFSKHEKQYDSSYEEPVIRCSICTGEQVAGFLNLDTGKFEEVMLIRTSQDLENFQNEYGITGTIKKILLRSENVDVPLMYEKRIDPISVMAKED